MSSQTKAADAYRVVIGPENTGLLKIEQTEETAREVSELLQSDLEKHHVFFNDRGFINHMVHCLLALFGTGATASSLRSGYQTNASYQLQPRPLAILPQSWDDAEALLGDGENYATLLRFFQQDITVRGWRAVWLEHVLSGTPAADSMLVRTFSGLLHPVIHLMYGMEFDQPAIVAEALAQAAVHKSEDYADVLLGAESRSRERAVEMPSILQLYEAVGNNDILNCCVTMGMPAKIRDGVLATAARRDAMIEIMSLVSISPEELEERTAEMFNAGLFVAASAAAHPVKVPKFDFFQMHHVNASPAFLIINAQDWIPRAAKVRLLEWKIRMDLLQYAARACPPIDMKRITAYNPRDTVTADSLKVIMQLHSKKDDGHSVKLGRSALICRQISKPFEDRNWMAIKGDDLWMKVCRLIVESVTGSPGTVDWVRATGLAEAWAGIPDLTIAE